MQAERLGNGLGDTNGMSLPYIARDVINRTDFVVSAREKAILRDLARRVAELAARPIEEEKRKLWYAHNDLQRTRPVVFCDPENGWYQIIRARDMQCEGALARIWEYKLKKEIFWGGQMLDDKVVEARFGVQYVHRESGRGLAERNIDSDEQDGAYTWDPPLKDYADFKKMHFSAIQVDADRTASLLAIATDVLGDILSVQLEGAWWWGLLRTADVISLRGIEPMMMDMYDYPDDVHRLMAFLRDEAMMRLDFLEEKGLLSLNNNGTYVGSGGFGWTHDLPQKDFTGKVRTIDMWGFCESQETVYISPQMFDEFILTYQLPVLRRFGINAYGCCEPLDKRWEVVKKIPRLRRVSVSAWADVKDMAEKLGNRYIYSWKPAPADLARPSIDEAFIRAKIRKALRETKACNVEIIMKDNHTIENNPQNVIRWCAIAREEADAV
jgi:hypothetical protein